MICCPEVSADLDTPRLFFQRLQVWCLTLVLNNLNHRPKRPQNYTALHTVEGEHPSDLIVFLYSHLCIFSECRQLGACNYNASCSEGMNYNPEVIKNSAHVKTSAMFSTTFAK